MKYFLKLIGQTPAIALNVVQTFYDPTTDTMTLGVGALPAGLALSHDEEQGRYDAETAPGLVTPDIAAAADRNAALAAKLPDADKGEPLVIKGQGSYEVRTYA